MSRIPCLVAAVVAALLTVTACGADRPIDGGPVPSAAEADGSPSAAPVNVPGERTTPLGSEGPPSVPGAMYDPDPAGIVPVAEYFALLLFDAQARLEVRPLDKVAAGTCSFCLFILAEITRQTEKGVTLTGVDAELTGPGVVVECIDDYAGILELVCVDVPYRAPEAWETYPDGSVRPYGEGNDAFLYLELGSLHHRPGSDTWFIYSAIPHTDDITT